MSDRIINGTDEEITIEPGESIDVRLMKSQNKVLVGKMNRYKITEVEDSADG